MISIILLNSMKIILNQEKNKFIQKLDKLRLIKNYPFIVIHKKLIDKLLYISLKMILS